MRIVAAKPPTLRLRRRTGGSVRLEDRRGGTFQRNLRRVRVGRRPEGRRRDRRDLHRSRRRYDLDPDDKINELLHRRDTWSGKTIFWPVQGTNLKVPVDLAALPTYSRSREFDGFRGFGIVRVADARAGREGGRAFP